MPYFNYKIFLKIVLFKSNDYHSKLFFRKPAIHKSRHAHGPMPPYYPMGIPFPPEPLTRANLHAYHDQWGAASLLGGREGYDPTYNPMAGEKPAFFQVGRITWPKIRKECHDGVVYDINYK